LTNKEIYRKHCESTDEIILFQQPWWLDVICGSAAWDVVISTEKDGRLQGALPYFFQSRYGFTLLRQPTLTPYLGIIFQYPLRLTKISRKYAFEQKVVEDLIRQLPAYSYFNQHFHPSFTHGQALHWTGMNQSTYYSSQIDIKQSLETIYNNFEGSVRTDIRKAEAQLSLEMADDVSRFYELSQKSFQAQSKNAPYDLELLLRLDAELSSRSKRDILLAVDKEGRAHAGIYIVKEKGTLYTLMMGSDPDLRQSGAVSFLMWRLIKLYHKDYETLDFCGSMIQSIQRLFRSFGSMQMPYLRIYHKRGLFKFINALTLRGE